MVVLLCSHPATAVSAGATTAGVRGGVGLYSCGAVTMQQLSVLELQQLGSEVAYGCSCNSWGQRWRMVVLLCSHPATAVSAGATTAGVRGGVGLYSCGAVTMQQLSVLELQQLGSEVAYGCTLVQSPCNSCQCWSYNSWGQRWRRVVLLWCSHHATAVSAGAATAGVRGGVWLYSCAVTLQQLSVLELQQLGSEVA